MNRSLKALGSVVLLAIFGVAALVGCGDQNATSKLTPEQQLLIEIPRIYQFSKLGRRQADGQFVVLNVILANQTNAAMKIISGNFQVRNITNLEEQRYSLPVEKLMASNFAKEFGEDEKLRVLERSPFDLNPRIQADRFLIFQIPEAGSLVSYELFYRPLGLAVPLMSSETELIDRRR